MVFQIDAVLRREYQRIEPRAYVASDLTEVFWWLDGEVLGPLSGEPTILLEPGRHALRLRARDVRGRLVKSREVVFVVLGLPPVVDVPVLRTTESMSIERSSE